MNNTNRTDLFCPFVGGGEYTSVNNLHFCSSLEVNCGTGRVPLLYSHSCSSAKSSPAPGSGVRLRIEPGTQHRVYIQNWQAFYQLSELGPPHLLARKRVLLSPLSPRGETHSLAGEGVGGNNSDDGTDTLVL